MSGRDAGRYSCVGHCAGNQNPGSHKKTTEFLSTAAAASHKTRQGTFCRAFSWDQPVAPEDPACASELFSSFADDLGSTQTAQRSLKSIVNSASFDKLLCDFYNPTMSTSVRVTAAHFLSASCSDAVAWTQCIPNEPEFVIHAEEYRWLLGHHFRLPVPNRALLGDRCTHPEHQLDNLGHHLITCMHHRTIPHDNTRDRIREFCAQAGLKPIAEPRNLLHDQATGISCDRRPDIAAPGVDPRGKLLFLDVITTNVGCKTAIKDYKSATDRGSAARGAEQRKAKAYEKCLDPNSQSLMPLAFELQGRWSPISLRLVEIIKRVGLQKRDLHGQRHSFWAGF